MADLVSDEALYQQLLAGDLRAFDALYARYERPLFAFIRSYVKDRAHAEEVFHDAFLAVLREQRARSFTISFKAWLYQVARNLCLNRRRSEGRSAKWMAALRAQPAEHTVAPDEAFAHAEASEALQRAISRLPTQLRELYVMRADGMSYDALAKVLNVPVGTVKSRMNAMLKMLREELDS